MSWFAPADEWPEEVARRLKELSEQGCSELNAILQCINDAVADAEDSDDAIQTGLNMLEQFHGDADHLKKVFLEHGGLATVYRFRLVHDDEPQSPREWDNLGTMACWHRRYTLGDEQPSASPIEHMLSIVAEVDPDFEERLDEWKEEQWKLRCEPPDITGDAYLDEQAKIDQEANERIRDRFDEVTVSLPLHLYDHSGITMSTGSFNDPWDSGQVGFIYVTHERLKKEYEVEELSGEKLEQAEEALRAEVRTYDDYLTGAVIGFIAEQAKVPPGADFDTLHPFSDDLEWEDLESGYGFFGHDRVESGLVEAINEALDQDCTDEIKAADVDYPGSGQHWVLVRKKVTNGH